MLRFLSRVAKSVFGGDRSAGIVERYKAHVMGDGLQTNVLAPDDGAQKSFATHGALEPPLPLENMLMLLFTSNSLRQNIDAMVTNIDGFGWRPVPTIDVFGENRADIVSEFLAMRGRPMSGQAAQALADNWKAEAERERDRMLHWFEYLNPDLTFDEIRKRRRQDYEVLGNAAWEIVRDRAGRLRQVHPIPFVTLRLLPLDGQFIEVQVPQKIDAVTIQKVAVRKRFRRYVQVQDNVTVFFKELGDPRIYSASTGDQFKTLEAMQEAEPGAVPATEILHFNLNAPNESYGLPRWVGTLPEVIGSRMAAEVNVLYFENKSVPPLVMMVSGGRVSSDSIDRIRDHIQNHIKGEENFHNILIVEAETEGDAKNAGKAQIKIQPLTEAIHSDALFQKYDQRNIDKVGAVFRIPGMLRGDIKELNRATAEVAKALAEEQVFEPERRAFDDIVNRKILPHLGIRFWEFKTNAPVTRSPSALSTILSQLVSNNIVMPAEARSIVPEILGRELPRCEEEFLNKPPRVVLAEIRADAAKERRDQKGDASTDALSEEGGLRQPQQGDGKDPFNGKDRKRRLRELLPLAEDAAMLRQLIERIELREDAGSLSADEIRSLIERDGTTDSEESSPDAAPAV